MGQTNLLTGKRVMLLYFFFGQFFIPLTLFPVRLVAGADQVSSLTDYFSLSCSPSEREYELDLP
jgi:hypothetical protein